MKEPNFLFYGFLSILSGVLLFSFTGLSYTLLSFKELFYNHPFLSWGIPLILIILGMVSIEIDKEMRKNDE